MISQHREIFKISRKYTYIRWLTVALIFLVTLFIPLMITVYRQPHPNLNLLLTCYSIASFLWIGLVTEFGRIASLIELNSNGFTIKKVGQKGRYYLYTEILAYNERPTFSRAESFNELTIYLTTNWFFIRSNEFSEYDYLKEQFIQYGKSVSHQKVLSLAERNRFRWLTGGLALLILANIAFGYMAHNPTEPNPAQLTTFTDIVDKIVEDRPKGHLKGVFISLRTYPSFSFYVSRRDYDTRLDTLRFTIATQKPITLLIRKSDYRKKLQKTEPLTFGDKYSDYKQILVFGIRQTDSLQLQTSRPVYETTHTNPRQRTILLGFLLLLCWTGWVYVDRHKVLRAD